MKLDAVHRVEDSVQHAFHDIHQRRGPELRERFRYLADTDAHHVYVIVTRNTRGESDVVVWKRYDDFINCMARLEEFEHDVASIHWVVTY